VKATERDVMRLHAMQRNVFAVAVDLATHNRQGELKFESQVDYS